MNWKIKVYFGINEYAKYYEYLTKLYQYKGNHISRNKDDKYIFHYNIKLSKSNIHFIFC